MGAGFKGLCRLGFGVRGLSGFEGFLSSRNHLLIFFESS